MFVSGRNPLQMFSLYNPRFKRAPQRALRARGMNWNINSIAGAIASAAQGVGKTSEGRTLKSKAKGLKGMKGKMKGIGKQGRAIKKGGKVSKVVQRPKAAEGAGGPAAQETTGGQHGAGASRGYVDTMPGGAGDILKIGAHEGFGGFAKAFGAVFADAMISKLLTGSGITSWLVYGTGEEFGGLRSAIKDKAEASYAPTLAKEMAHLETEIGWVKNPALDATGNQRVDQDGNKLVTVNYTDVGAEGGPTRVTETITEAEAAGLFEQTVAPVMMLEAGAAHTAAATMAEEGGDLHQGIEATIEEGAPKFGVDVEGEPISAIEANVELGPGASTEEVPGTLLAAKSLETPTGEQVTDASAVTQWVDQLEIKAQNASITPEALTEAKSREADLVALQTSGMVPPESLEPQLTEIRGNIAKLESDLSQGTMTPQELQAATEVFKKATGELGAEAVAQDDNLTQLGNAILIGSSGLVEEPPAGMGRGEALELAMYSQSVVADAAIESGASGVNMVGRAVGALGNTYEQADQMVMNREPGTTGTLSEMTSNFSEAKPSSCADFQQIANQINSELREFEKFQVQSGIDPNGTSATAEYLLQTGQFRLPADYEPGRGGPFGDQTPGADMEQARRTEMVKTLDPASAAKPFDPSNKTIEAANAALQPGTNDYQDNVEKYHQAGLQAFDAVATALTNQSLGAKITADKVSDLAPVNLENSQSVEQYARNNDMTPQEVYNLYAPKAEVDYAHIKEDAQGDAAKTMDPLWNSYQVATNDAERKERGDAYAKLQETLATPQANPVSFEDGRASALTRLYTAMDASGDDSRMNDSNRRSMEQIAKKRENYERAARKSFKDSASMAQIRDAAAKQYVKEYDDMAAAKTTQLKRKMDRDFDDLAAGRPQQRTWQQEQAKKQKEKAARMREQKEHMLSQAERQEAEAAGRRAAEAATKKKKKG